MTYLPLAVIDYSQPYCTHNMDNQDVTADYSIFRHAFLVPGRCRHMFVYISCVCGLLDTVAETLRHGACTVAETLRHGAPFALLQLSLQDNRGAVALAS